MKKLESGKIKCNEQNKRLLSEMTFLAKTQELLESLETTPEHLIKVNQKDPLNIHTKSK